MVEVFPPPHFFFLLERHRAPGQMGEVVRSKRASHATSCCRKKALRAH